MIEKISVPQEHTRLLILAFLVLFAYHPFLSGLNIGSTDAKWYQYLLHDAIIQFQHGLFPPVVGQSPFNYIGISYVRAPYYLFLAIFIHILTFGHFNALFVQHFTVLASALLAAFFTYFLLINLAPRLRWYALLLAFFYVSCPATMALIYSMDMYNSFMTLPFIPLVIYGLIRAQLRNDFLAYTLISAGLSLIWMSHPPIALWMMTICFITLGMQVFFLRKGLFKLLIIPGLFLLLNFWQFIGVFSFGLQDYSTLGSKESFINSVLILLKKDMPGVFLPLKWRVGNTTEFLQLGYSLWLLLTISFIGLIRSKKNLLSLSLFTSILFLLLLLYPFPWVSYHLWEIIPVQFDNVTLWPMQRLYLPLAALVCFIGILSINQFYFTLKPLVKFLVGIIFISFFCWNIFELNYFFQHGAPKGPDNTWSMAENIYLMPYGVLPLHYTLAGLKVYDPVLENQLLDQQQRPMSYFDNLQALTDQCVKKLIPTEIKINNNTLQPFFHFNVLNDKHLFLCMETYTDNTRVSSELISSHFALDHFMDPPDTTGVTKIQFTVPFYTKNSEDIAVYLARVNMGIHKPMPITIKAYGVINYDRNNLPIHITSFSPYKAWVKTNTENTFLYVFKEYYPGYIALVNGKKVSVSATKNKMIMIPLKEKGMNQVELVFHGTSLLRFAFFVSSATWIILLNYLLVLIYRKTNSKKPFYSGVSY